MSCAPPSLREEGADLNDAFENEDPLRILRWTLGRITPGRLILTTSFGPGGIVLMHLLRRLEVRVPVVFIDTLYHFAETLTFARDMAGRWALDLRTYRPAISRRAFEAVHGPMLWERDLDAFHRLTRIEPMRQALVGVDGWLTARRRDQADSRRFLPHAESGDPLKVNPLASWSGEDVWRYIRGWKLPHHPLHDRGYASIGDEPLTTPTTPIEHERAGRWRGTPKSECGLHLIGRPGADGS